jgi:hypothetical protein
VAAVFAKQTILKPLIEKESALPAGVDLQHAFVQLQNTPLLCHQICTCRLLSVYTKTKNGLL